MCVFVGSGDDVVDERSGGGAADGADVVVDADRVHDDVLAAFYVDAL